MMVTMLVAAVSANAQLEPGTFSLQPKAGATVSWLSNMPDLPIGSVLRDLGIAVVGNDKMDKSVAIGAMLGVEAEYQVSEKFSIAAGINYAMQGSGWSNYTLQQGDSKLEVKDAKIELGYVNVPLVANFYIFKGFAVKAGAQFGFLTSAKEKATITGSGNGKSMSVNYDADNIGGVKFKDECKKFDLSIPVGVSYEFKVPVVIDLRYNIGLLKVNKESASGVKDSRNNVIQLTVGYKLAL